MISQQIPYCSDRRVIFMKRAPIAISVYVNDHVDSDDADEKADDNSIWNSKEMIKKKDDDSLLTYDTVDFKSLDIPTTGSINIITSTINLPSDNINMGFNSGNNDHGITTMDLVRG